MGRKAKTAKSSDNVVVDSRFEKVFVDPKFAKSRRRNVATGDLETEVELYEVLDHVNLDPKVRAKVDALENEENFAWDAASTSDESLSADELVQRDFEQLKEGISDKAWTSESNIERADSVSDRLALMGLDWTNLSAADVYVICHSSSPGAKEIDLASGDRKSSAIRRVAIYTSNFGRQALDDEEKNGPSFEDLELMRKKAEELASLQGELTEATALAIRAYEKKRAMYYYAVVECASVEVAEDIYEALDGMDADFAIDGIDVRYIPADITEFTGSPTSEAVVLPKRYLAPAAFQSNSRHTRPELHWDENDQKRTKTLTKRFTDAEMNDLDIQEYVAASDSDQENGGPDPERIASIRRLLLGAGPAPHSETSNIEGTFKIQADGSLPARKVAEESGDEGEGEQPKSSAKKSKRKHVGGFELLLKASEETDSGPPTTEHIEAQDGPAAALEAGGVSSSDDEDRKKSLPTKKQSRREKMKAKANAAKIAHQKKKMQKLQERALVEDLKEDDRFAEMFADPKHFVDCVEEQRRSKKSRHK